MTEREYVQALREKVRGYWPDEGPEFPYGLVPTVEYLAKRAEEMPSKVGLNFYGREITYRELNDLSNKIANYLFARGYRKGDFIGIHLVNCPQWAICYWGITKIGGIAVSLNPLFKEKELHYQINDANVKAVFTLDQLYPVVQRVKDQSGLREIIVTSLADFLPERPSLPLLEIHKTPKKIPLGVTDLADVIREYPSTPPAAKVDLEDPAYVCYTGGTTGLPKGCLHTHKSAMAAAALQTMGWRVKENDVGLFFTPMFLITTKSIVCDVLPFTGSTVILLTRWDPQAFLQAVDKYRVTWTWTARVDAQVEILNYPGVDRYDLTCLKRSFCSPFGIPLTQEIREKWGRLTRGGILCDFGYGMTENHATGAVSLGLQDYDLVVREGIFVGLACAPLGPLGEFLMKIVDPDTKEIQGFGVQGEIAQKSVTLCRGYLNKPEETRSAFDEDGWFYTGDIGIIDENGFLTIRGRRKEMIKVSGMSVFPKEIEEMLISMHPAVENAAVIGVSDPHTGEAPVAFVQLKPEYKGRLTELDILTWCRENMSKIKIPRQVLIIDEIPLNPLGKVAKEVLRSRLTAS